MLKFDKFWVLSLKIQSLKRCLMGQTRYEMDYKSNNLLRWMRENKCERQSYICIHESRVGMPLEILNTWSDKSKRIMRSPSLSLRYTYCESRVLRAWKIWVLSSIFQSLSWCLDYFFRVYYKHLLVLNEFLISECGGAYKRCL